MTENNGQPGSTVGVVDVLVDNAVRNRQGMVTAVVGPGHGGVVITVSDGGQLNVDAEAIFERRSTQAAGHSICLATSAQATRSDHV